MGVNRKITRSDRTIRVPQDLIDMLKSEQKSYEPTFEVYKLSAGSSDLGSYLTGVINRQHFKDLNIIEQGYIGTLGGNQAYKVVYTYSDSKAMTIGTIINGNIYYINYDTTPDSYDQYLPIVQQMVNSFRVTWQDQIASVFGFVKDVVKQFLIGAFFEVVDSRYGSSRTISEVIAITLVNTL